MRSVIVEEFALGVLTDNVLLAQAAALGEPVRSAEMIELSASSRALYNTCILTSRELGRVTECHQLWQGATEVFEQMHEVWKEVEGDDYAKAHISLLSRLRSLSLDRVALYHVSAAARASFARRKANQTGSPVSAATWHVLEGAGGAVGAGDEAVSAVSL